MEQNMIQTLDVLRREIKALTFDQYGTIVDMQQGLTEAVTPFLKRKGWDGKPNNFVTWWRRTHFENSMIDALCDRGNDDIWRRFCAAVGTAELATDRRFANAPDRVRNRDALVPLIKTVIKQRSRDEWLKLL